MSVIMNTLIKNIQTVVSTIVIKYDNEARQMDTIDSIMDADQYVAAKIQSDSFSDYPVFDVDVLINAGMLTLVEGDVEKLYEYAANPRLIPNTYKDAVLSEQRKYIIDNYIEANNYYRTLAGLPNLEEDESEFFTLTPQQLILTGISNTGYIHEFSTNDLYKLQEHGILDELIAENPTKEYLKYLGVNKIEPYIARMCRNFDIMRISKGDVSDEFFNSFMRIYSQNREYFTTTIYNRDFATKYSLYDKFIGLCIMFMTIQRLVSNVFKFGINREFYDWDFIRKLYATYNLPFIENLPIEYQMLLLKNMNNLLRYKSTDKVLFDVCSLLGYDRLNIFKYYLVKRQKLDENENPVFCYKKKFDDDGNEVLDESGNPIYEEDFEKMYNIYFQGVDIRERNVLLALQDSSKEMTYADMIDADPYWWEDDELHKLKYETTYNYIETKYLSMNVMYKMTEMLFEVTYFMREIISNYKDTSKITIDLPKVHPGVNFDLFHIIIFMVAAMCKIHGFSNYTITDPSKISHIYGFSFDDSSIEAIRNIVISNPNKVDQSILTYFENLTITRPDDVNRVYDIIYNFNDFIINKMRDSQDIEEYHLYKDIFKISMISKVSKDMFTYYTYDDQGNLIQKVASSYIEYLEHNQPIFASIINDNDAETLTSFVSSTITRLEMLSDSLKYLFIINDSTENPIYASLIQLLKFFKSYTVDLNTFNIVYVFDSKYYNLIKMIQDTHRLSKYVGYDDDFTQYYTDIMNYHINTHDKNNLKYNEYVDKHIMSEHTSHVSMRDSLKITI